MPLVSPSSSWMWLEVMGAEMTPKGAEEMGFTRKILV